MSFDGTLVKEQGVTFTIVVVKPHVLTNTTKESVRQKFSQFFGYIPTILMANQHVVPKNKQWQLKCENAARATKNFHTQKEAIEYGRNIANRQQSELNIHDRKGLIRDKDSYRKDPCPPKDTRF